MKLESRKIHVSLFSLSGTSPPLLPIKGGNDYNEDLPHLYDDVPVFDECTSYNDQLASEYIIVRGILHIMLDVVFLGIKSVICI